MEAQPLQLPVSTDANLSAGLRNLPCGGCVGRIGVFVLPVPVQSGGLGIEDRVRNETPELWVVVYIRRLEVISFRPRTVISSDDKGRRVVNSGLRDQRDDILEKRSDGELMFIAAESVNHMRQIE